LFEKKLSKPPNYKKKHNKPNAKFREIGGNSYLALLHKFRKNLGEKVTGTFSKNTNDINELKRS